jgi:hypothetical protein
MVLPLRPNKGGFLRPFGCGWFIKEYLLGNAPYGSPAIDPIVGSHQGGIFYFYKEALRQITAVDRAVRLEEKKAKKEHRPIDPDNIDKLTQRYLERLPYKSKGCRYHSFVNYFARIKKLNWVEPTGMTEVSQFQDNYPEGNPRIYYRLTETGRLASDSEWSDPRRTLYG